MSTTTSATSAPVIHEKIAPKLIGYLGMVHPMMADLGLAKTLSSIIELRVSQINQCAYCVNMHLSDARKAGVNQKKLDNLIVWKHVDVFTPAERAALAWAEALTYLAADTDYGALRSDLRSQFSDQDITVITTAVGMINLWNRVQVSKH
ncbi:carboxymuconolactone decarboxylase family protein [Rhodobacteraceae bacterium B1Z28]|uniref:Carboxymuconolactone decarboxylase family protein n=1 Tax=Ruegeria haliotis TaxID=2747601 RepID=A0ABX2PT54_9RHOB|nr:carboxymuconolactone decarboxylase family protein [Ruegeria haliotis]NVO56939.1 carboxymuconolactone decarboxylase family protein [Ruegeria haliotis]